MKIVDNCINLIQTILKSQHCYLCDEANNQSEYDICPTCLSDLPYINQSCSRCALPLETLHSLVCGNCVRLPPSYDVLISPFHYTFPIDKLIAELKFRQKLYCAQTLGNLFCDYLIAKSSPLPECIIPVPLHHKRLQERGYNQSLEIARVISKRLRIPIENKLCIRVKNTKAQSGLKAKIREQNIKNAFELTKKTNYTHVALLDDVVTTGYTVETLAKLLRQQNINIIQVWSIARVNQNK